MEVFMDAVYNTVNKRELVPSLGHFMNWNKIAQMKIWKEKNAKLVT
jgi:hypothetical protein